MGAPLVASMHKSLIGISNGFSREVRQAAGDGKVLFGEDGLVPMRRGEIGCEFLKVAHDSAYLLNWRWG